MNRQANRVGLGTYPLGGVFTPISKEEAKKIVKLFIDQGGYYIDTAPHYGFGAVETLLGEALRDYPREKYYIATKCGYVDVEGKTFQTVQKSGKYVDVIAECEKSLKRLRVDYIDLYFVHSPDPNTPFDQTMSALIKLQKVGKIRGIGVSNVNIDELKKYNKSGKVTFVQNRFSLLNRSISREFEEYMIDNSIQLVPYQIIDRGQLTGKVLEGIGNLRDGDVRNYGSDWQPEKLEVISHWVQTSLSPIAKRLGITLGQMSIAWALRQKYVGFVIVGLTNPMYIDINSKANSITLSDETAKDIDAAYGELARTIQSQYKQSIREFRGLDWLRRSTVAIFSK